MMSALPRATMRAAARAATAGRGLGAPTGVCAMSSAAYGAEFRDFLANKARVQAPKRLDAMLDIFPLLGMEVVSPTDRKGLNPLLIPLAKNHNDGSTICFLRWPTQKEGVDMQIVRTNDVGVSLISISTDHYVHRHAVEMDAKDERHTVQVASMVNAPGPMYKVGDIAAHMKASKFAVTTAAEKRTALDRYLLTRVGPFPDCYARLAETFLASNNEISALITCERSVNLFYSWGQPLVYHAKMLKGLGRDLEAADTVKTALSLPKWTLAHSQQELQEAIKLAGYSDSKVLGDMHAFRSTDPRTKDIEEGVSPQQIVLDQAAHVMDAVTLGNIPGGWEAAKPEIARRYREGGYPEVAEFIEA